MSGPNLRLAPPVLENLVFIRPGQGRRLRRQPQAAATARAAVAADPVVVVAPKSSFKAAAPSKLAICPLPVYDAV